MGPSIAVTFCKRSVDGLDGEELFMTIGDPRRPRTLEHRVIWRYPGQPRDPARPELELELGLVGVEPEVALTEWERLVGLLRIADREGVEW